MSTTNYPALGTEIDGCIYAGVCTQPDGTGWHLLVPIDKKFTTTGAWGDTSRDVAGAQSYFDGLANTKAMAAAGSELALRVLAMGDGLYIPSRVEALVIFACERARQLHKPRWHWTSTQDDASCAWSCHFDYGIQSNDHKSYEGSAVAVRRLPLGSFIL